ncbi:hypothetical protein MRX96_029275 [Rhipicephalus microplus]
MLTTQSCLVPVSSFGSKVFYCFAITAFLLCDGASAWTQEDLELFDVVEDVNENFYTFLGLSPDVDTAGIKKAYRKLSLQFHPDKNKEEGSEEKFRKIVAVVEILKDEEKRKKYDAVLENGLPDWRQPVYYYRRVRKMGIAELSFFLVVLLTLGQHVVAWAAYWERKFELEETVLAKFKRKERKSKKLTAVEDEIRASYLDSLGKPSYLDLLIVRFIVFLGWAAWNSPTLVRTGFRENPGSAAAEPRSRKRERATRSRATRHRSGSASLGDGRELYPRPASCLSRRAPRFRRSTPARQVPEVRSNDRGAVRKTPWGEEDTVALHQSHEEVPNRHRGPVAEDRGPVEPQPGRSHVGNEATPELSRRQRCATLPGSYGRRLPQF